MHGVLLRSMVQQLCNKSRDHTNELFCNLKCLKCIDVVEFKRYYVCTKLGKICFLCNYKNNILLKQVILFTFTVDQQATGMFVVSMGKLHGNKINK